MWDFRPVINVSRWIPVTLRRIEPAVEPNVWILLTYSFLCSIGYGPFGIVGVVGVTSLIQLYRVLFGFRPLDVAVWLPGGLSNYPMAILKSIISIVRPSFDMHTAFFLLGPCTIWYSLSKTVRVLQLSGFSIVVRIWRMFQTTKRVVFYLLLIYFIVYSSRLVLYQSQILLSANHHNMVDAGRGAESLTMSESLSVSIVVIRANNTAQRPLSLANNLPTRVSGYNLLGLSLGEHSKWDQRGFGSNRVGQR
jgi:hypothetical protein